jgi:hypothetical protein
MCITTHYILVVRLDRDVVLRKGFSSEFVRTLYRVVFVAAEETSVSDKHNVVLTRERKHTNRDIEDVYGLYHCINRRAYTLELTRHDSRLRLRSKVVQDIVVRKWTGFWKAF